MKQALRRHAKYTVIFTLLAFASSRKKTTERLTGTSGSLLFRHPVGRVGFWKLASASSRIVG
jgi:hypothetical protein